MRRRINSKQISAKEIKQENMLEEIQEKKLAMSVIVTFREFQTAAIEGNLKTIGLYINQPHANLDAVDQHGATALMYAAKNGHLHIIKALIDAKADLHVTDKIGCTALTWATLYCHPEIINVLTAAGANPNSKAECSDLMRAVMIGHVETVNALIAAGAKPDVVSRYGLTPLMLAAFRGHEKTAKALIQASPHNTLNMTDENGNSALSTALSYKHFEVAKLLIEAGADITISNKQGATAKTLNTDAAIASLLKRKEEKKSNVSVVPFSKFSPNKTNNTGSLNNDVVSSSESQTIRTGLDRT